MEFPHLRIAGAGKRRDYPRRDEAALDGDPAHRPLAVWSRLPQDLPRRSGTCGRGHPLPATDALSRLGRGVTRNRPIAL